MRLGHRHLVRVREAHEPLAICDGELIPAAFGARHHVPCMAILRASSTAAYHQICTPRIMDNLHTYPFKSHDGMAQGPLVVVCPSQSVVQ